MSDYTVEREIAVIGERAHETIELKYIKWGKNPAKYDLRKWGGDTPYKGGVTLTEEEAERLYWALSEELGYGSEEDYYEEESDYDDDDEEEIEDSEYEEYDDNDEDEDEDDYYYEYEYEIDERSFFVVKSMDECDENGHDYFDVNAVVNYLSGSQIKGYPFRAKYCQDCNVYYIHQYVYNDIKKIGGILCPVLTEAEYNRYRNGGYDGELSNEGPLKLLGYSVAKDGLSSAERQRLLSWIIANNIMGLDKERVMSYLKFFIRGRQGNTNMSAAVQKWQEDLDFVRGRKSFGSNAIPMGVARFINGRPKIY